MSQQYLYLNLYGTPLISDKNKKIIHFSNKKEICLIVYLVRMSSDLIDRDYLRELLWPEVDKINGQSSLRRALANISRIEKEVGVKIIRKEGNLIGLIRGAVRDELQYFLNLIRRLKNNGVVVAKRIFAERYLFGLEAIGEKFADWVGWDEQRFRRSILGAVEVELSKCRPGDDGLIGRLEAVARLADPDGIRVSSSSSPVWNERVRLEGMRQTIGSASDLAAIGNDNVAGSAFRYSGVPASLRSEYFPAIFVRSISTGTNELNVSSRLVDEISHSTEYRVRFRGAENENEQGKMERIGIENDGHGAYNLKVSQDKKSGQVALELQDRFTGTALFYDVYNENPRQEFEGHSGGIKKLVLSIKNVIENQHIAQKKKLNTVYGKIIQIEKLSASFDKNANIESLELVSDLESRAVSLSHVHAFKAAGLMKQRSFLEVAPDSEALLRAAQSAAQRAVEIDPWHAYSRRMLGFASHFLGDADAARDNMMQALTLAPSDQGQKMATAEILAFIGDVSTALEIANQVYDSNRRLPRYFNGYMSHIMFSAGNYHDSAVLASQSPIDIMEYKAVRIAALSQLGYNEAAAEEFSACAKYLLRQDNKIVTDRHTAVNWLRALNLFKDAKTRMKFDEGIRSAAAFGTA